MKMKKLHIGILVTVLVVLIGVPVTVSVGVAGLNKVNKLASSKTAKSTTGLEAVPLNGQVLQAATEATGASVINFNAPAIFNEPTRFNADIDASDNNLTLGEGELTASNVIYSIQGINGITVTGGQNAVISFTGLTGILAGDGIELTTGSTPTLTNTGVTSFQGESGAITLDEGDGIEISGTEISNDDPGTAQDIFKIIAVSGQNDIEADENNDTLTFVAGSNITLTTNDSGDALTISSAASAVSGWEDDGTDVRLSTITDNVGIGTATPGSKLHVVGTTTISSTLTLGGSMVLGSDTVNDLTGDGLAVSGSALTVNLTTSGSAGSTSSNSGLEVSTAGLTMIKGCADGELLKWDNTANLWECATDDGGTTGIINVQEGDVTVSASAGTLDFLGNDFALTESPAGEINVAIDYTNSNITRTNQNETITGTWTFSNVITANGGLTIAGGQSLTLGSDAVTDLTGTGITVSGGSLQTTLGTSVDLASAEVTGTLPVGNGGTGATSYTAGSVVFSNGTILTQDNTNLFWDDTNNRLGIGDNSPNSALTIGASDAFQVNSSGAVAAATGISSSGNLNFTGSGTYTLANIASGASFSGSRIVGVSQTGVLTTVADGSDDQVLTTDGAGVYTWKDIGSILEPTNAFINNGNSFAASATLGTNDTNSLALETDGTTRITILATGNTGIGDASPASLFTVGSGDLFQVNSSGAIAAATGVTSSGTITFTGLGSGSGSTLCIDGSNQVVTCAVSPGDITAVGDITSGAAFDGTQGNTLYFEGTSIDANEIALSGADATVDRTITLPDLSGTVALLENSQTFSGAKTFTAAMTIDGNLAINSSSTTIGDSGSDSLTINATILVGSPLVFEGSTADGNETTLTVTDPTADRTITIPDLTGTVALLENAQTFSGAKTFSAGLIVSASGASITGGIDNNSGGITEAGAISGVTTLSASSTVTLTGLGSGTGSYLCLDGSNNVVTCSGTTGDITAVGDVTSGAAFTQTAGNDGNNIYFEGSSADGNEIALTAADPGSDLTVTLPAITGTLASLAGSQTFTGAKTFNATTTFDGAIAANTDIDLTFAAAENMTLTNSSASTDQLSLSITGVTTDGVDAFAIAYTQADDADSTDTNSAVNIALTSSSGDADALYGLQFADFTSGSATETALRFGTGFDNILEIEGSTADANETFLTFTDPTSDRTVTFPDASGTVCLTSGNCAGVGGVGTITAVGDITSGAAFTQTAGNDGNNIYFEGSSADGNEIALTAADPGSDLTVTLPAITGTLASLAGTQTFTGAKTFNATTTFDGAIAANTDIDLTFAAAENMTLTNTSASSDQLSLSVTGVTTDGVDAFAIAYTQADDADSTDTNSAINIALTSSSGDADVFYGLQFADFTAGTATETAFRIGTGFDNVLEIEGSTADGNETSVAFADPTADRTVTFPDSSGTVCLSSGNCAGGAGGSKWTDSGTLTYLTDSTDSITIGSTSELAKLAVDGDADEIQLLIQGNGTQTSSLLVLETSAGTDQLTVSNAGALGLEGAISDITGATVEINDDLQVTGNDILDSGSTSRVTLGSNTILTNTTTTLSGTTTLTASSLATLTTAATLDMTATTTLNCTDCINFDDLSDSLSLDAGTTIALGTNTLTLNASGTGDVIFQDNGTPVLTFNDSGNTVWSLPAGNNIQIDGATADSTTTTGVVDVDVDSATDNNIGMSIDYQDTNTGASQTKYALRTDITIDTNGTGNDTVYGNYISFTQDDAAATAYGLYVTGEDRNYFSGNVGIGDSSPTAALTVGSGDAFQVNSSGAVAAATGITSSGTITFSGLGTGVVQSNGSGVLSSGALDLAGGASYITGVLPLGNGGTGFSTYTQGDLLYASAANTLSKLAVGGNTTVLTVAGGVPTWATATVAFNNISGGTNTTAAMVVGTGSSLNFTGSGTINASTLLGSTWASPGTIGSTAPNTGAFTSLTTSGNTSLTTGAGNDTTIGNATGTFELVSDALDISTTGALSGATGLSSSGNLTFTGSGTYTLANIASGASFSNNRLVQTTSAGVLSTIPDGSTPNQVLITDSNGNFSWTSAAGVIAPDSLDFTEFSDSMSLDASTSIAFDAAEVLTLNAATVDTTTTGGVLDMNIDAGNAAVIGLNVDFAQSNGATAATDAVAQRLTLSANDADGDMFGLQIVGAATTNAAAGSYEAALSIDNVEDTVASMTDAILITSSGVNNGVTDAIDISAANINNAINAGANFILMDGIRIFEGTTGTITIEDTAGNDLMTIADGGTVGNASITGTLAVLGSTIGLDSDADADNLIGTAAAGGAAASNLYWGNRLLCDATQVNCGWSAVGGNAPWTTTSNVVNLNTATDNVTVGSATNLAKLAVDGDTDEIQLLIQGNGTQTANLVVFETSAGTDQLTLSNAGALAIEGAISDISGTVLEVNDDLKVTGNDIIDSGDVTRISLGATTTLTNSATTLSGTTTLTATSLATFSTAATLDMTSTTTLNCTDCVNFDDMSDSLALDASTSIAFDAAEVLTLDAASTDTTTTGGVLDFNIDAGNAAVLGLNIDFAQSNGATAATDAVAQRLTLSANDADGDMFGLQIIGAATANAAAGSYEAAISIDNAEDTAASMTDAILITSSGVNNGVTDAIDVSAANINNAINVGANFISMDGVRMFEGSTGTLTFEDTSGNDLMTIVDNGTNGNVTITNNLSVTGTITANTDETINGLDINAGAISDATSLAISSAASTAIALTRSSAGQWMSFNDGTDAWGLYNTAGSPEGVLAANTGALSMDTTNGTLYVKTDDGDNTGWVNLATGGSSPWQTTSNVTNQVTSTDDVTVGSAVDLAKLGVDGDSDEIQFLVQGNGTQTAGLLVLETSAGTDQFTVSNAGAVGIEGAISDITGTVVEVNDDLKVTGNDIIDSGDTTRISLGATTTLTNTTTTLSGTTTLTASSLATLTTAATLSMASTTTLNCGDCIDFDDMKDSLSIDAATDINLGANALTIDMDSTGDFSIRDGTTDIMAFTDSGAVSITPTSGQNLTVTAAGAGTVNVTTATGSQTYTSSVVSGTTTTSAFIFDATAITTGTGMYVTTDSITQGNLMDISTTGNTLTSGNVLNLSSTSTALTSGRLASLDWSPGSTTTATGDLFRINIGSNGNAANLFNVTDNTSSLFSVAENGITSAVPHSFTAAGDVAIAYDLQFTNQTASYIKSNAPLYIEAGEAFESNDITIRSFNSGGIILEGSGNTSVKGSDVVISSDGTLDSTNIGGTGLLAYGAICADDSLDNADDCIDAARSAGTVYGIASSFAIDDVAENFPTLDSSIEAADIVALDYQEPLDTPVASDAAQAYETEFVKKATLSDNQKVLGAISGKPGVLLGGWSQKRDPRSVQEVAVGLSGRIPIKVTSVNGPIEPGDYIALSNTPGVGAKANDKGYVVGMALGRYDNADSSHIGSVLVFLQRMYYNPITSELAGENELTPESLSSTTMPNLLVSGTAEFSDVKVTGEILAGNLSITGLAAGGGADVSTLTGPLRIQPDAGNNVEIMGGKVIIDTEGNIYADEGTLTAKTISAEKINVSGQGSDASIGSATIAAWQTQVTIDSSAVTENSQIFVTAKSRSRQPLAVTATVSGESFTVEIPEEQEEELVFSWWIIN